MKQITLFLTIIITLLAYATAYGEEYDFNLVYNYPSPQLNQMEKITLKVGDKISIKAGVHVRNQFSMQGYSAQISHKIIGIDKLITKKSQSFSQVTTPDGDFHEEGLILEYEVITPGTFLLEINVSYGIVPVHEKGTVFILPSIGIKQFHIHVIES